MSDQLFKLLAIQNKLTLDKKFGSGGADINDDVILTRIGGQEVIDTAASEAINNSLWSLPANYVVPPGYVAFVLNIQAHINSYTVLDDWEISIHENVANAGFWSKGMREDQRNLDKDLPLSKAWAAAESIGIRGRCLSAFGSMTVIATAEIVAIKNPA